MPIKYYVKSIDDTDPNNVIESWSEMPDLTRTPIAKRTTMQRNMMMPEMGCVIENIDVNKLQRHVGGGVWKNIVDEPEIS